MRVISIDRKYESWRQAARELLAEGRAPEQVMWRERGAEDAVLPGFCGTDALPVKRNAQRRKTHVPAKFVEVAECAACHRDPGRWGLLYGVLWRISQGERDLMEIEVDDQVRRLTLMRQQVAHDECRMMGLVRFRVIQTEGREHYVAWHRPDHFILRRVAGFFRDRFAGMRWSILTPDESMHWNGRSVQFTAGVTAREGRGADDLEGLWRTYYASVFNAARVNPGALKRCMPVRYWEALVEGEVIGELLGKQ